MRSRFMSIQGVVANKPPFPKARPQQKGGGGATSVPLRHKASTPAHIVLTRLTRAALLSQHVLADLMAWPPARLIVRTKTCGDQ